jgi:hypothetical protein
MTFVFLYDFFVYNIYMNIYLEKFIKNKFKESGSALDLGAGDF